MNKKSEGVIIWIVLAGTLFFALRLPFLVYGGAPEIHNDILQPRFTATPLSAERAMTQQAFAMMFFTPTYTVEPTQPFLAFLLPITGATQTFTPTVTYTAILSATPTRTLLPLYITQTREQGGGGPIIPPGAIKTFTPAPTSSAVPTAIISTATPIQSPTNIPSSPTATSVPPPTATPTEPPTDIPTVVVPPTDIPTVVVPPTDIPTVVVPPTDIPTVVPPGGNSLPGTSSTSSPYLLQFIMMYLVGAAFLGVVVRR